MAGAVRAAARLNIRYNNCRNPASVPARRPRVADSQVVERKLAAIFAADVVGYSQLMEQDETGTLRALRASRAILDRVIAEHRGRILTTAGDSVLADFASAVDAVECALAVQQAIAAENAERSTDKHMQFRIGVHLGDVVVDGANLLGDGVNIAARLQTLAEPGGICVSAAVRDQIGTKLPAAFVSLGGQRLKNIAQPLQAFEVYGRGAEFARGAGARSGAASRQHRVALGAAAAAVLIALVGAGLWVSPVPLPVEPQQAASPPAVSPSEPGVTSRLPAPRLSIVVLPFANLSNDPEQEYFADGIADDLTTDLSRIAGAVVIARNSAFSY